MSHHTPRGGSPSVAWLSLPVDLCNHLGQPSFLLERPAQSKKGIWDIAGITAFFGLSNRKANVISMRPNDEFYLLGRLPRVKT